MTLEGVSWETYERLLAEHQDPAGTRFTYNEGTLQIMVLSARHEQPNEILRQLVQVIAEEWRVHVCPLGSTTFKRSELLKGFEPDAAYYVGGEGAYWNVDAVPEAGPPPDLIIEVDVTSWSLDRFPIFAAFGVAEVWRYDGRRVAVFRLQDDQYVEVAASVLFPPLTGEWATRFLEESRQMASYEWLGRVREWAREQR